MVHIGVDHHKRFSQLAILTETGEVIERRVPHEEPGLRATFASLPGPCKIAFESNGCWYWFVDLLEGVGHEVVMANPKQVKAIASARLKNDRVDAKMLAHLLRTDLLPTVWIPPRAVRESRELLVHRHRLVRIRTQVKNALHALVAKLVPHSEPVRLFSARGQAVLTQLPLEGSFQLMRQHGLALKAQLDRQIQELDRELRHRAERDVRVRRLLTIPGIGVQTASALVAYLCPVARFPSAKHVASYVGLSPTVRESAGKRREGRITKEGAPLLRHLLVEAAGATARQKGVLQRWYRTLAAKKGWRVAKVALARKLVTIAYHVLRAEQDFAGYLTRQGVLAG